MRVSCAKEGAALDVDEEDHCVAKNGGEAFSPRLRIDVILRNFNSQPLANSISFADCDFGLTQHWSPNKQPRGQEPIDH
jgi:hypothetical protein